MCCIALVRCVLVLRCGSTGVVWYPYAAMSTDVKGLTTVGSNRDLRILGGCEWSHLAEG